MRLAWLTDIHLNFLSTFQIERFLGSIQETDADAVLISGDIAEASRLVWFLRRMADRWQRPIYFVLGNHDYYKGSFRYVHNAVRELKLQIPHLVWLQSAGIIELTPETALIGHDGWADGRCGDYAQSTVMLNDYVYIRDFVSLNHADRGLLLNQLGDEAAMYGRVWLSKALERYRRVYFVTHVPPFAECALHEGQTSSPDYLPHFACRVMGETLLQVMQRFPAHHLTVLCGHTHEAVDLAVADNLRVVVGAAEYGRPALQQIIEI